MSKVHGEDLHQGAWARRWSRAAAVALLLTGAMRGVGQGGAPAASAVGTDGLNTGVAAEETELRARLKAWPSDLGGMQRLAELLERTGRSRAALRLRREVLSLAKDEPGTGQAQTELAIALVEDGQNEEAARLLEQVIAKQPEDEPAMFELGTALARQEKFTEAFPRFARAAALRPDDAEAQLSAAKTLVTLLRFSEAEGYLEAAARDGAVPLAVRSLRGAIYRHTAREGLAVTEFEAAAQMDPTDAKTQLDLGEVLRLEGRNREAAEALRRSASLKPSVGAYFQLAKTCRAMGDAEGERAATEALRGLEEEEARQTKVAVLLKEGERAVAEGHPEQAARVYEEALRLRPREGEVLFRSAILRGERGDAARERQLLGQVLAVSPEHAGALSELGRMEEAAGQSAAAKAHLVQALRADPQNAGALSNLGVLEARAGDFAAAERLLQGAVESDPESASAYRNLGLVEAAEGRAEEAERALKRSEELAPKDVQTRLALGQFLYSRGRLEEAKALLAAGAGGTPLNVPVNLLLAAVLAARGEIEAAVEATNRVLAAEPEETEARQLRTRLCEPAGANARKRAACAGGAGLPVSADGSGGR